MRTELLLNVLLHLILYLALVNLRIDISSLLNSWLPGKNSIGISGKSRYDALTHCALISQGGQDTSIRLKMNIENRTGSLGNYKEEVGPITYLLLIIISIGCSSLAWHSRFRCMFARQYKFDTSRFSKDRSSWILTVGSDPYPRPILIKFASMRLVRGTLPIIIESVNMSQHWINVFRTINYILTTSEQSESFPVDNLKSFA